MNIRRLFDGDFFIVVILGVVVILLAHTSSQYHRVYMDSQFNYRVESHDPITGVVSGTWISNGIPCRLEDGTWVFQVSRDNPAVVRVKGKLTIEEL